MRPISTVIYILSLLFSCNAFGQHFTEPELFHVSLNGPGIFAAPQAKHNELYTAQHQDKNFALSQAAANIVKSNGIRRIVVYRNDSSKFREYLFDTNGLLQSIVYSIPYTTKQIEISYFYEDQKQLKSVTVVSENNAVQRIDSLFVFAQDTCTMSKLVCWKSGRYLNAQNEFYNSNFPEFGKKGSAMVNNYYFSLSESRPKVPQPTLSEAPFRTNYPEDTLLFAYTEMQTASHCSSDNNYKIADLDEEIFEEPMRYVQPFHGCGSTISSSWIAPGKMTASGLPMEYLLVNHSFMSGGIKTNITRRQPYYLVNYEYF